MGQRSLCACLPARLPVSVFVCLQGLIVFSRLGVYLRLPGVDVERFSEAMQGSGAGIMGYIDTLSGGWVGGWAGGWAGGRVGACQLAGWGSSAAQGEKAWLAG